MLTTASRLHRSMLAVAIALTAFGASLATAGTASAARSYHNAQSFRCEGALVRVSPPRVWASGAQPEQVGWGIALERWNGSRWYTYMRVNTFSTFNYYGQSLTSWSGGRFHNSTLNLRVRHRGHYRVASALAGPGVNDARYVAGGSYCYIR